MHFLLRYLDTSWKCQNEVLRRGRLTFVVWRNLRQRAFSQVKVLSYSTVLGCGIPGNSRTHHKVEEVAVRSTRLQFFSTTSFSNDSIRNLCNKSSETKKNSPKAPPDAHWKNTFISASRVTTDYLLKSTDLEDLTKREVRSAHDSNSLPIVCYLKSDVEKKALEVWGSWGALETEQQKRQMEFDAMERRRKFLSELLGNLKKNSKDFNRKYQDQETFGGRKERVSLVKGSGKVVLYAIISNLAVFIFKVLAYSHTHSSAMLSEAIHSLADLINQCFLGFGIAQSIRSPDPDHPYGWSRVRYVYSLISGVGIFFIGAGVTGYHGIHGLIYPQAVENLPVALSVLGASFLVEGLTLIAAIRQVQISAQESGVSFKDYVLRGRDPSAVAVLVEDGAAIAGVTLAASALTLTQITGNVIYDALGSITICGLLGGVALFLVQRNSNALVGQSIPLERLKQITDLLESDITIRSIHDVKATDMGADTVRFKAEVNFDGREIAKIVINQLDLEKVVKEVQDFKTVDEVERFLLEYGEQVVDVLGAEVDRIELKIKKASPEVRHVDLEIL